MNKLHQGKDRHEMTLDANISAGATSLDVSSGQGASAPDLPFYAYIDSELFTFTERSTDTFTVEGAQGGTSLSSHFSGTVNNIKVSNTFEHFNEKNTVLEKTALVLSYVWGGSDGVLRGALDSLEVVAQAAPDMTVRIKSGIGFASNMWILLEAVENSVTMVAPVSDPRIDIIQISKYDVVSVKTGSEAGSPSAPAVDADNTISCEIYHRVGTVHIDDVDDSSNSYITDKRVFL